MMDYRVKSPIVLIAFNRPDLTQQVLDRIRMVKPERLFLIVDGPRSHRPEDNAKCQMVRSILDHIDWTCEISHNYADENMGCFRRVVSGLSWVFEQVDRAIILEDDIVPDISFFRYCDDLLEHYCDDERVTMISGYNLLGEWKHSGDSYHFSHNDGIWGWATWRRAWKHYDPSMKLWANPRVRQLMHDNYPSETTWRYRYVSYDQRYDEIQRGTATAWALVWNYTQYLHSGLAITPSVNMVENLGINVDATHSSKTGTKFLEVPIYEMSFPLKHPEVVMVDHEYDRQKLELLISGDQLVWIGKLRVILRYIYWRYLRSWITQMRRTRA